MGLFLTILYIVLTIISPAQFGPAWANYHALVYLAVITALFSLPNVLSRSSLLSSVQTYLLLAFIFMVGFSQIANHWLGGALNAWLAFLPSAAVFFFIVANVNTLRHLKIVVFASVAACLALVAEALLGYYAGFLGNTFFMKMNVAAGQAIYQIRRLRAVGFLHDPNDFSQMLIIVIALLFVAWRQGRIFSNTFFVLVPSTIFLWAVYLTHSRGALIGLAVLALVAGYKRLGKVPALVLSGALGLGLMALDFTGGRAIDPSAGADRLELWAEGLEMFKHSPLFGVGFGNFTDFSRHTAHNSFILPLAELGILGATLFVALLTTTTLDVNRLIALRAQPLPAAPAPNPLPDAPLVPDALDISGAAPDPALASPFGLSFDPDPVAAAPAVAASSAFAASADAFSPDELPERLPVGIARLEDEPVAGRLQFENDAPAVVPATDDWQPSADSAGSVDSPAPLDSAVLAEPAPPPSPAPQSADELIQPGNPLAALRAALVTFMATAWFLSRTYDTTIYLILGLAVASINLEPAAAQPRDHRRWIGYTLAVVAFLLIFIYLVVRLRH